MFLSVVLIFIFAVTCNGVITDLSESEYYRLPPLYGLDEYRPCLVEPTGLYCVVDATLYAEKENELMNIIKEYSAVTTKHFNHTQIHRGVCVTRTCQEFIADQNLNIPRERDRAIEKCLNHTISKEYGLQVKLGEVLYCNEHGSTPEVDTLDTTVMNIYILIILLSIIGTVYDKLYNKEQNCKGNPYLLAFSIPRNWAKLTAPSGGLDPRLNRLRCYNGMRAVVMMCVIFSHAEFTVSFSYIQNTLRVEKGYEKLIKQLMLNAVVMVFSFIAMSSFLLSYNLEILAEKRQLSWMDFPKGVLLRWLRLTPPYALTLATVVTYMRHMGWGPLWDLLITREVTSCRQYWWAHLLYVQNYITADIRCMPHSWYLAVDTQLFYVGLLICVCARSPRARRLTLSLLFLLSLVIVAAQTYDQDLDALVLQTPESLRTLYASDDTFRQVFIRGHTNLSSYILGLAAGFLAFQLQKIKNIEEYSKKYRWVVWSLLPIAVALALTGNWSYLDEGRPSLVFRVLYATFYKCIFVFMLLAFVFSCMFKTESFYRGIAEWRGFTWMGRVTYNAFLVHTIFQKALIGEAVAPIHASGCFSLMFLTSSIMTSFGFGALMYLFVEAPVAAITNAAFRREDKYITEDDKQK